MMLHKTLTLIAVIIRLFISYYSFDLSRFSLTSLESEVDAYLAKKDLPDVVLVRKVYATKAQRKWKLRSMEYDEDQASPNARDAELREQDYEGFLQEIEGDKEMRANINLYKAESATATATATANSNTNTTTSASMTQSIKKSASGRNKGSKVSTSKKASKASSTTANGASKGGKTSGDGNEEGEWEDMDEDGDRFDGDEEAIRLDELLDEMTLTPLSHRGATTNANTTNAPTGDADASADTGNLDGAHALESDDLLLLSPQDANSIAPVVLSTSGFDAADFNLSSVKFK